MQSFNPCGTINRLDIWDALNLVHVVGGLDHNDFHVGNVVFRNTPRNYGPFIIDFEKATPHQCGRLLEVREGELAPMIQTFGCEELFYAAEDLGIWRPRESTFSLQNHCMYAGRLTQN